MRGSSGSSEPHHAGLRAYLEGTGTHGAPIVYVHGGSHTGACYLETPDGRAGWAPLLAARGHAAYVYDWPGRGARPPGPTFARQSLRDVAADLATLIEAIDERVILLTHSMGGVVGWSVAERLRERIAAIVAIAPGPPANVQQPFDGLAIERLKRDPEQYAEAGMPVVFDEGAPVAVSADLARAMWMNAPLFPHEAAAEYLAGLVPESPRAMNERNNILGSGLKVRSPQSLAGIPIVIITGDYDPRHPRATDQGVARYFDAQFVWLPDIALPGHGHMQMLDRGNQLIADWIGTWTADHSRK